MALIYFVEDDNLIYDLINATLQVAEYNQKGFTNPLALLEAIDEKTPDLLILDLMLPNISGYEVLERLNEKGHLKKFPVIILSAKSTELDKVKGLDLGASDYITKPFGVLEFLSRIKAMLRRFDKQRSSEHPLICGELFLDTETYSFKVNDHVVDLTVKEFDILELMMKNVNKVITREQFLNIVWGYEDEVETRALDMHINKLRTKIAAHTSNLYIETIRGIGYILKG